ncbi:MAG: alginate lyase family protein, partial [Pseudomonadota bacterium]
MSSIEVLKRLREYLAICYTRVRYRNPVEWPYSRFGKDEIQFIFHTMPGAPLEIYQKHYNIYNYEIDLTEPIKWNFSETKDMRWPDYHYARIKYRPGNPYGDVRINWELNRLQFLPQMAVTNETLARTIITDWLEKNPYVHGPSYLSSMEVALRWISIYWAVCLFKESLETSLQQSVTGLALASGEFIESRLSTHSSAGNHLIVEAVGLFWIGKALQKEKIGNEWIEKARKILWEQVLVQLNSDGTNQEQSFWYLGFVVDALFHYLLLEDRQVIPKQVLERIQKATEFVHEMVSPDSAFPDYGDRDDGVVFRVNDDYKESPFPGLLNVGSFIFNRPDWFRGGYYAKKRLEFWTGKTPKHPTTLETSNNPIESSNTPQLKTYSDGGMTLMKWGKGRILFRHAPLGSGDTCGHGHADALSVLFSWDNIPLLIDLGSGQYNGNQDIRNFFRSTIAHNTIEIGGINQAKILGPFLWER